MARYEVTVINTVYAVVEVEAASEEAAEDLVWSSDDMPGSPVVGAFGVGAEVDADDWSVHCLRLLED